MNKEILKEEKAPSVEKKFTDAQNRVLKHSAGNLLVSASAGSGKTSVLIEKIVRLIGSGSVKLKNLLVVTFTNSASAEIKQRLYSSLAKSENKNLLEQIDDLSVSDIVTFDSFCIKVVKEFGYAVGQHNNFSVADETLSGFLKNQALNNVFANHNKNTDGKFINFVSNFFGGREDDTVKSSISQLYNFLKSKSEDNGSYRDLLEEMYSVDNHNRALKYFNDYLLSLKNNFVKVLDELEISNSVFCDPKVTEALSQAKNQVSVINDDVLNNIKILRTGFEFASLRRNGKEDVSIYDIKTKYAEAKKEFTESINKIFTKEIKSLTSEQMKSDLQKTKTDLEYIFDIVEEFDKEYLDLKQKHNVLDFNDIERIALHILQDEKIADSIKNRYDWIFIDEYQDTSLLQESIIKKITTGDNLFMVGDFKQSIYRFRQAEPQIFINKYNTYKKMQSFGSIIDLNTNFRSEEDILKFDNFVFDKIFKNNLDGFEYSDGHDLIFGNTTKKSSKDEQIKILVLEKSKDDEDEETETEENQQDNTGLVYSVKDAELVAEENTETEKEALVLADQIEQMLKKEYYNAKSDSYKKIEYSDIAVLSRNKKSTMLQTRNILKKCGIPVNVQYTEQLFDGYDMQMLLSFLKVIDNHKNDMALFSSLSNFGKLSFEQLAEIRYKYKNEKFYYDAVEKYLKEVDDEISQKLNMFFQKVQQYRTNCMHQKIDEIISSIVLNEKLDEYFAINNYGEKFESHKKLLLSHIQSIKDYSLSEYVQYVENFGKDISYDVSIKDGENAVTITTIHGSKGLEYPVVFLIGTGKAFGKQIDREKILMDNDWGISMSSFDRENHLAYENLIKKTFKLKIKNEEKKEEKRLLYVALTRPKNYLTIIGSAKLDDLKELDTQTKIQKADSYLKWIIGAFNENDIKKFTDSKCLLKDIGGCKVKLVIETPTYEFEQKNINEEYENKVKVNKTKFCEILYQKFAHSDLSKKNSVTQIMEEENHYNISDFYYLKDDRSKDEDFLAVGTAYHKYMELLNFCDDENNIKQQIEDLKSKNMLTKEECMLVDEKQIIDAIKNINEIVTNRDIVLKEQQFLSYIPANELVNSQQNYKILLQGVADLIIIKEDEIYLVDYKTTKAKSPENLKKTYSTQLNIYAKAIENFYQKKVSKKMIYSFYLNKLLTI